MYRILRKEILNPQVKLLEIEAPYVARKAEPGQFIILRVHDEGERIPLTIADYDREKGSVTIIFQEVGATTRLLGSLEAGDAIADFCGPLGVASHFEGVKKAAVIGGGLGTAIAYPQAKKLFGLGVEVDVIIGFRNKDLIILEQEMAKVSNRLFVTTDDGSNGTRGFVSDILKQRIEEGAQYDVVIAIGPPIMMKVVCDVTRPYGIKTIVSLNPVMIDGTGMCGGCRVTVGGETKFACVDGPDFDGHLVDFDELIRRLSIYREDERISLERHACRLGGVLNA
ncbi:MAG TPA: sulfide/dihydroorotate dehydrogenase-like FAD/NAD-binding protein [Thermoclostridium caenicola]|uniref:Ferredoxin--NADP+ reductase n=1 Tax=Thermoclostridium caenicola TaxID=659425 RepID=A0A1M6CZ93_9FIRM|nr:sulfide/dihydroorotate dehydrogenase-like FAD/NAD-binding protein [Thermoclostridium caenicola]SHI66181.1 ferredoxin--NADP+ reductase [Thermoclostridium caenicola]HOK42817.1 sulfide/dihydroorotate dehydrogenase-like FAD/NAD-binding protein [Thermoclostridium caenicola]HOL84040.1 sulfide/dihydroorotate dehydrogenase-like FAD/NAD-binding protein [Thermoclostridium caenicola]HOP71952.1 sulfide/dihydroorotate dehydrogenase-like FAD/NAD-binding protein [Thermoclostridium caenicola]HPO76929.1 sul